MWSVVFLIGGTEIAVTKFIEGDFSVGMEQRAFSSENIEADMFY